MPPLIAHFKLESTVWKLNCNNTYESFRPIKMSFSKIFLLKSVI